LILYAAGVAKTFGKISVILKTSTLLRLHRALIKRKYRLLYSSGRCGRPGSRGPSRELIDAVVEMKGRNPYFGCRKIAEQISNAFGIELNKDVVRRILTRCYRPAPGGGGLSWLSVIWQAGDRLWSVDLSGTESTLLKSYWVMVVMDVYTRRIVGFSVAPANLDGVRVCRMFNRAIARQAKPRHLSSDHDPCFTFIAGERTFGSSKSMRSRPFPQRLVRMLSSTLLIGTIRREYLDRIWF
jgi:putative transposase